MQLRHLPNPLGQQRGSFAFTNYFIYIHNWCIIKVGDEQSHQFGNTEFFQKRKSSFSHRPLRRYRFGACMACEDANMSLSNKQLLEGGTHNTWQTRGVNQNGPRPFYLAISTGRPKMKPLAISFCSIPLLSKQDHQNDSAASVFKVCLTIENI